MIELVLYKKEGYLMRRTTWLGNIEYAIYDISRPPVWINKPDRKCIGRDKHILSDLLENKNKYETYNGIIN